MIFRRDFVKLIGTGVITGSGLLRPFDRIRAEGPRALPGFPVCRPGISGPFRPGPLESMHIRVSDGTRIALDLVLPAPLPPGGRVPTLLTMTRYWRSEVGATLSARQVLYATHGFASVIGDVRGTGASFGRWLHHRSRAETWDFGDIIDWIAAQPWSNGAIVGWGSSYTANTADWMVERRRTALQCVISRFPDYDPYADLYFPGGVPNAWMGRVWGTRVKELDLNVRIRQDGTKSPGVRPVDKDRDGTMLSSAIAQRKDVPSVWEGLQEVTFRDDRPASWNGSSMDDWGIHSQRCAVEAAATPMQSWAAWMDAGTANGVLHRFMTLSNPQRVIIGPWSHGGYDDANPYEPESRPVHPSVEAQSHADLCFIERVLGTEESKGQIPRKELLYYTLGEDRWKVTPEWPLPDTRHVTWYFDRHGRLSESRPCRETTSTYTVDFSATTGTHNRWATNNAGGDVVYGDRAGVDAKLLCFTSPALPADLEVTGQPLVILYVASTHTDGNFFIYLEDVSPEGIVRYLTEGLLRAIHRRVSDEAPPYRVLGPYHSFKRADSLPLVPGSVAELSFSMLPISVLIRAGHRIRVALAGADADTFARVPAKGTPKLEIYQGATRASRIVLPTVPAT